MNMDLIPNKSTNHDRAIAKGAFVQALGSLGKLLIPLFYIIATRLYGPEIVGLYLTAFMIVDIGISLTVTGFNSGVTMFASRWGVGEEHEKPFYQMMANAVVSTVIICVVLVVSAYTIGPVLLLEKFPQPEISSAVAILVWTIPMQSISMLVVAATKASLSMKWDAVLFGLLQPLSLLVFAAAFYFVSPSLDAILWGNFASSALVAIFSIVLFHRLFSYSKLWWHIRHFKWFGELLSFALPQNLNMTFNTFITSVDIVMLAYLGTEPAKVAFYGMGAQVVRNIRQIKIVFSNAYAPVIARYHGAGDTESMNRSLTKVSRWTLTLGIPVAIVVAVMRKDLLLLFHDTFSDDSLFMVVLIAAPLMSLGWGMAGNVVVMTGHSLWNLVNSVTIAAVNAALNYLLIPVYGLLGAAVATVVSSAIVTVMQIVEAKVLVGAQSSLAGIAKPLLALVPSLLVIIPLELLEMNDSLWRRALCLVLSLGLFMATLIALRIDPEDKEMLMSRFRKRRPAVNTATLST